MSFSLHLQELPELKSSLNLDFNQSKCFRNSMKCFRILSDLNTICMCRVSNTNMTEEDLILA